MTKSTRGMINVSYPRVTIDSLLLGQNALDDLNRFVEIQKEYRSNPSNQSNFLVRRPANKIVLTGALVDVAVEAIAGSLGLPLVEVSYSEVVGDTAFETKKNVHDLRTDLRTVSPCVIRFSDKTVRPSFDGAVNLVELAELKQEVKDWIKLTPEHIFISENEELFEDMLAFRIDLDQPVSKDDISEWCCSFQRNCGAIGYRFPFVLLIEDLGSIAPCPPRKVLDRIVGRFGFNPKS